MQSSREAFSSLHTQQGWYFFSLVEFTKVRDRRVEGFGDGDGVGKGGEEREGGYLYCGGGLAGGFKV